MALSKTESGLFGLLAEQPANIFQPVSAVVDGLSTRPVQGDCGMFFDQPAQAHNRTQRFWTSGIKAGSSPLSAGIAQYGGAINPIPARRENWSAPATHR